MRLFIALDIPEEIRAGLTEYLDLVRPLAPDARWARIESLHVTLKFIGEVKDAKLPEIKSALAQVKGQPFQVEFKDVGFFPNPKSARVFWAGVNGGDPLAQLASATEAAVEKVGIPRENRPYHPHLTLARAAEGMRHCFRLLQERLSAEPTPPPHHAQNQNPRVLGTPVPHFGTMTAQEFFLYQSQTMRGGARYTKLQRFAL